ncbi:MAG: DNA polymerase III subunit delta [Fimbriimonadaceae bacterium]
MSRVVMLSGDEGALRRRALAETLKAAGVGADDLEVAHLDGSTAPSEWLGQACTAPFLSERRVVIVRNVLRAEAPGDFAAQCAALPEYALLVLVADEEAGDDNRQARLKTTRTQWEKAVAAGAGKVEKFAVSPKEVQDAIRKEALRLDKKISERCAQLVAEMTGGSLSRAIEELEKVAIFIGAADTIREEDVRTVVMPSRDWNVFKLCDAIVRDNASDAIRQLRILVESPQRAEEAAFRSILPMLSRQFRLLWQARACIEAGTSIHNAPPDVQRGFPSRPNIGSEPPYRQSALLAGARGVTFHKLSACFSLVADADARLKGLLPAYSAMETLESAVLAMAALFAHG